LVGQTLTDIEIILVDDGSPDRCPAICDEYAQIDSRIKVIHKKNGGVSAARNDGLDRAMGEYVIFCDSDDWMEQDALEVLYNTANEKNADIVIADINRIMENGSQRKYLFAEEFTYTEKSDILNLVVSVLYPKCCKNSRSTNGYGGAWNKAIRRSLLLENGIRFDTAVAGVCDDRLVNVAVYMVAKKLTYVQKPVYNYVLVENSITQSFKERVREIRVNNKVDFEAHLPKGS